MAPKKGKTEEDMKKSSENRKRKRDAFFENLKRRGLEFEEQDPKVVALHCNSAQFVRIWQNIFKIFVAGFISILTLVPWIQLS